MDRIARKKRLFLALIIVNVLFIWANSLLPGSISGAISGFVKDLVYKIFPGLSGSGEGGHGLLRKLGHFTEFACLGALLTRFLFLLQKPRLLAVAVAFLVGCCDETIQRFVPDRGPSFRDVLIDTAGATAGMILLLVGYAYCKRRKKQATEENHQ